MNELLGRCKAWQIVLRCHQAQDLVRATQAPLPRTLVRASVLERKLETLSELSEVGIRDEKMPLPQSVLGLEYTGAVSRTQSGGSEATVGGVDVGVAGMTSVPSQTSVTNMLSTPVVDSEYDVYTCVPASLEEALKMLAQLKEENCTLRSENAVLRRAQPVDTEFSEVADSDDSSSFVRGHSSKRLTKSLLAEHSRAQEMKLLDQSYGVTKSPRVRSVGLDQTVASSLGKEEEEIRQQTELQLDTSEDKLNTQMESVDNGEATSKTEEQIESNIFVGADEHVVGTDVPTTRILDTPKTNERDVLIKAFANNAKLTDLLRQSYRAKPSSC